MGDHHDTTSSTTAYPYVVHHPHYLNPGSRQQKAPGLFVHRAPPSSAFTPPYSPLPLQHHHHDLSSQPLVLPHLLLHPILQLSRADHLQLSAPHAPVPAVIVSPHSLSPPPQRDSVQPVSKKPTAKPAQAHRATDGNKDTQRSVHNSAPTMTSNGVPNMAGKREDQGSQARGQRPSLVSQHSNSVPSTPLQVARRYETRSRSPSPSGGLGSHSPRSVSSEANSTLPAFRPSRPFKCKFETNVGMLGRRRVPYQSDEILEKPKEEPKKALDPHEDDKLSGDMRELYDRLQPTQQDTDIRDKFVKKIERILETEFPGNEFKVHIFGSSGNMLWTAESDVDICIQTPMKRLEEMHMLAEALDKHGMERVVCIPAAKVRIVKIWDPELQLACDINVNNVAAIENTRMIKTYIQIDDRVRPLAMIIKHWTKRRILNDAGIGGTISSYTWICLILNFLQTCNPPILPVLHNLHDRATNGTKGKAPTEGAFADDVEKLRGFGDKNKATLGQLLFAFFRLYGHEIDYEVATISVRQGRRITREEKGWHPGGGHKEGNNRLCVEEPFNTDRNLGNSADGYAWRGIHLELRRAFDLLADNQQLAKACEQFEFPPEEKTNSIFKKPQSQKATITSSLPNRGGRGGSHHRGRGGFGGKGQYGGNRRSSQGSNYNQGRPPFLHSPPMPGAVGQEYFPFPERLHDHLFQQYQLLEMQSNSLRAQLAAQHQRAQQMQQLQAQGQNRATNGANGSPPKSNFVNGGQSPRFGDMGMGLPPNGLPQGFLYHYPNLYNPAQPDASGQDGARTNPSSPSLSNSMPGVRRTVHRTSNASDTGSLRSHSQPPRGVQQQPMIVGYPAVPQYFDPSAFNGYPIMHAPQDMPAPQPIPDPQYSPKSTPAEPVLEKTTSNDQITPSIAEPIQPRSLQDYAVGAIPTFSELAERRKRVPLETTQPLLNMALRRVSRSPSPLGGHERSQSTGILPQIASSQDQRKARIDSARPPVDNGPMIVNGSTAAVTRPRGDTIDAIPPEIPTIAPLDAYTNSQAIQQINELQMRQQLVLEEMQRQNAVESEVPPIVNGSGSTNQGQPVDNNNLSRVPSEGMQPFPALQEGWMNFDPSQQQQHAEEVSPTHNVPSQWPAPAYTNGLPSLDTSKAPRNLPQEIQSATLPLLSPVMETRTPSPTASRSSELSKLINGTKAHTKEANQNRRAQQGNNGSKENRNGQQKGNSPANERAPKAGASNNNNNGHNNAGAWRESSGRKKKNKNKNKGPEQKTSGEAPPANAADRKGG